MNAYKVVYGNSANLPVDTKIIVCNTFRQCSKRAIDILSKSEYLAETDVIEILLIGRVEE